jgi:hypothetical protein
MRFRRDYADAPAIASACRTSRKTWLLSLASPTAARATSSGHVARAGEKGNALAAATHSITSSAWDEAGRHFGRAAEQVQTRAVAISEAWSAEFLSRDVQHQPLPGVSVFCV